MPNDHNIVIFWDYILKVVSFKYLVYSILYIVLNRLDNSKLLYRLGHTHEIHDALK